MISDPQNEREDEMSGDSESTGNELTAEDLQEPSTEKEPGEEHKRHVENDPEPDHEAVGVGVFRAPETNEDGER